MCVSIKRVISSAVTPPIAANLASPHINATAAPTGSELSPISRRMSSSASSAVISASDRGRRSARSTISAPAIGAIARDLIGDSGLGPVFARLAPNDQPYLGGERLAEGHRRRLALASFAPHNPRPI